MENLCGLFDVFIAYHGNKESGSQIAAEELHSKLSNIVLKNGKHLRVYCHPITNPDGRFGETPNIVQNSRVFILVADERIPVDRDTGKIKQKNDDGTKRYLAEEIAAFRGSEGYRKSSNDTAAKLYLTVEEEKFSNRKAMLLDAMFTSTTLFRSTSSDCMMQIESWLNSIFCPKTMETTIFQELEETELIGELRHRASNESSAKTYLENIRISYQCLSNHYSKIGVNCFCNDIDHSIKHCIRVIHNMGLLIGDRLSVLTSLELAMLSMSALYHDVGMIVSDEEIEYLIKNDHLKDIESSLSYQMVTEHITHKQEETLQYVFGRTRDLRAKKNIERLELSSCFMGKNTSYLNDVMAVCSTRSTLFQGKKCNNLGEKNLDGQNANLLYISIILHLADIMDFDVDYQVKERNLFKNIKEIYHIDIECMLELLIRERKCKVRIGKQYNVNCETCASARKEIYLDCMPYKWLQDSKELSNITPQEYDDLQCRIIEYIDYLEKELAFSQSLLASLPSRYKLNFERKIIYHSQEERTPNHKIDIDYSTTVSLLLGEQIYGNKRVGLREIVQNSIDACKYRLARYTTATEKRRYNPRIDIELDKVNNQVRIVDNGIGMNRYVLENFFLKIGQSLYSSEYFIESNHKFSHSGHFGIGFFAAFMLSDNVEIQTRHVDDNDSWNVRVNTSSRYSSISKSKERYDEGTTIILDYDTFERNFLLSETTNSIYDVDLANEIKNYLAKFFITDISNSKKIEIYVCDVENDEIEMVQSSTLSEKIDEHTSTARIIDLSSYLNGIECKMKIDGGGESLFYSYFIDAGEESFKKVTPKDISSYDKIIYQKIFHTSSESVYVYIPKEYWETDQFGGPKPPFDFDSINRQRAYVSRNEKVFGSITIEKFFNLMGWEFPENIKTPIMAYISVFHIVANNDNVIMYKKNVAIEQVEPSERSTQNGKKYLDSIYVRNVYIPHFHIQLPQSIAIINNTILPEIKKILVNIEQEGVFPNIDRNDMPPHLKEKISVAIGHAVMEWLNKEYECAGLSISEYGHNHSGYDSNIFIKESKNE